MPEQEAFQVIQQLVLCNLGSRYRWRNRNADADEVEDEPSDQVRDPDRVHSIKWNLPGKAIGDFQRQ